MNAEPSPPDWDDGTVWDTVYDDTPWPGPVVSHPDFSSLVAAATSGVSASLAGYAAALGRGKYQLHTSELHGTHGPKTSYTVVNDKPGDMIFVDEHGRSKVLRSGDTYEVTISYEITD